MLNLRIINKSVQTLYRRYSGNCLKNSYVYEFHPKISINFVQKNLCKHENSLSFCSRISNISIDSPFNPLISQKEIYDFPILNKIIENPNFQIKEIGDIINNKVEITDPFDKTKSNDGIQAARLIVIRRRKMKKHKLKKLRKKMKFEWAKVRQRREMRKEKAFQAGLIGQIKEAEKFSAEKYVTEKLQKSSEQEIPRFWKGKRLPQFIIKEKLGIK